MTELPLFIYGSLRDPGVRTHLFGPRPELTTCSATLHGYLRQMVPGFDYPFIVPAEATVGPTTDSGARVDGDLLLGLQSEDYVTLDHYEDLDDGLYVRAVVTVQTPGGPVEAWAYLRGPNAPPE
jgi:gamma-glutamylcyclotransferase (GGCT)/AIG2-like uncharacterized protein YtfP